MEGILYWVKDRLLSKGSSSYAWRPSEAIPGTWLLIRPRMPIGRLDHDRAAYDSDLEVGFEDGRATWVIGFSLEIEGVAQPLDEDSAAIEARLRPWLGPGHWRGRGSRVRRAVALSLNAST